MQQPVHIQANTCNIPKDATQCYKLFIQELAIILANKGTQLIIDEANKEVFGQIALWYAADNRFKGDLAKGLLIRGSVGTGKTKVCEAMAECMHKVENKITKIVHSLDLQRLYSTQGDEEIELLKKRKFLIIDDIGCEQVETKYYGNLIEPFIDLFDYRYRNDKITIITTNLKPSEIKTRYGERIYDRMRETLNDLVLDGTSKRK